MRFRKWLLLLLSILGMAGCGGPSADETAPLQDRLKKSFGKNFELRSIEYQNGSSYSAAPGAVVLKIEENLVTGKISCDQITAEVTWSVRGELDRKSIEIIKGDCNVKVPFILDRKMNYDVKNGQLLLSNAAQTEIAYFEEL